MKFDILGINLFCKFMVKKKKKSMIIKKSRT